jgi:hypothetical protein
MRTSRAWAALMLALLLAATTMAPMAEAVPPGGRIVGPEPEYFGDPDGSGPGSPQMIEEDPVLVLDLRGLRFAHLGGWWLLLVPVIEPEQLTNANQHVRHQ